MFPRTVLPVSLLLILAAGLAAAETPELKAMLEESERVQEADNAAWARSDALPGDALRGGHR